MGNILGCVKNCENHEIFSYKDLLCMVNQDNCMWKTSFLFGKVNFNDKIRMHGSFCQRGWNKPNKIFKDSYQFLPTLSFQTLQTL